MQWSDQRHNVQWSHQLEHCAGITTTLHLNTRCYVCLDVMYNLRMSLGRTTLACKWGQCTITAHRLDGVLNCLHPSYVNVSSSFNPVEPWRQTDVLFIDCEVIQHRNHTHWCGLRLSRRDGVRWSTACYNYSNCVQSWSCLCNGLWDLSYLTPVKLSIAEAEARMSVDLHRTLPVRAEICHAKVSHWHVESPRLPVHQDSLFHSSLTPLQQIIHL